MAVSREELAFANEGMASKDVVRRLAMEVGWLEGEAERCKSNTRRWYYAYAKIKHVAAKLAEALSEHTEIHEESCEIVTKPNVYECTCVVGVARAALAAHDKLLTGENDETVD